MSFIVAFFDIVTYIMRKINLHINNNVVQLIIRRDYDLHKNGGMSYFVEVEVI